MLKSLPGEFKSDIILTCSDNRCCRRAVFFHRCLCFILIMSTIIIMTKNDPPCGFWPFGFFCSFFIENNVWLLISGMIDGSDEVVMGKACRSSWEQMGIFCLSAAPQHMLKVKSEIWGQLCLQHVAPSGTSYINKPFYITEPFKLAFASPFVM